MGEQECLLSRSSFLKGSLHRIPSGTQGSFYTLWNKVVILINSSLYNVPASPPVSHNTQEKNEKETVNMCSLYASWEAYWGKGPLGGAQILSWARPKHEYWLNHLIYL